MKLEDLKEKLLNENKEFEKSWHKLRWNIPFQFGRLWFFIRMWIVNLKK